MKARYFITILAGAGASTATMAIFHGEISLASVLIGATVCWFIFAIQPKD